MMRMLGKYQIAGFTLIVGGVACSTASTVEDMSESGLTHALLQSTRTCAPDNLALIVKNSPVSVPSRYDTEASRAASKAGSLDEAYKPHVYIVEECEFRCATSTQPKCVSGNSKNPYYYTNLQGEWKDNAGVSLVITVPEAGGEIKFVKGGQKTRITKIQTVKPNGDFIWFNPKKSTSTDTLRNPLNPSPASILLESSSQPDPLQFWAKFETRDHITARFEGEELLELFRQ